MSTAERADAVSPPNPARPEPTPGAGAEQAQRIAGAALIVMLFFVLSRVTGLAREIIVGARFGTSAEYDAYLAAFRVPDLLFQLVAGGALGSAFIPVFSQRWVARDSAGSKLWLYRERAGGQDWFVHGIFA